MATTATPIFPQAIVTTVTNIVSSGASTPVQIAPGGTNGSKVEAVTIYTTDTATNTVTLYINQSSVNYPLLQFIVPAGSGNTTTIPFNVLNVALMPWLPIDANGNRYLNLASGSALYASIASVTSAKTVTIMAQSAAF